MENNYREQIQEIRFKFLRAEITYEEAQTLVKPILEQINIKGAEVSKKYGGKFRKLTFGYVFR